jgi:cytochrome c biogenesis protein CcdA
VEFAFPLVLLNALVLGFRHGIDWDHIAAITDLVGTTGNTSISNGVVSVGISRNAIKLATFYAVGHAVMVFFLGFLSIFFARSFGAWPDWITLVTERIVGVTLIWLAGWILYSVFRSTKDGESFVPKSRWMLIFDGIKQLSAILFPGPDHGHGKRSAEHKLTASRNDTGKPEGYIAFTIGLLHGIGAETVSQVLLIAAVGSAANNLASVMMLVCFVIGLLASNTAVAILSSSGFAGASRLKPLMIATSIATGLFSLAIGFIFLLGLSSRLVSLHG